MSPSALRPKVLGWLYRIKEAISVFLMTGVTLLVFIQVLLRYVFKAPLMGIEELLLFPTIWLYMVGGALASMKKDHISCGILTLYVHRPRSERIFDLARDGISFVISIWLTYWAYWFFTYSFTTWKSSDLLYIPMFFGESAVFVGLVLMVIYSTLDFYQSASLFMRAERLIWREGKGE